MKSKEQVKRLRSAASALEHGRGSTARKKLASVIEARAGLIPESDWDEKEANYKMHIEITVREWDTMLAALRFWQRKRDEAGAEQEIATEHGHALDNEVIDGLCERINSSPDPEDPVVVVEGGVVQDVFLPIADGKTPCTGIAYSLIDYDELKDGEIADDDIVRKWNSFSPALQRYLRRFCKDEFEKYFEPALDDACDCDDRSWHGPRPDSACPVEGER